MSVHTDIINTVRPAMGTAKMVPLRQVVPDHGFRFKHSSAQDI